MGDPRGGWACSSRALHVDVPTGPGGRKPHLGSMPGNGLRGSSGTVLGAAASALRPLPPHSGSHHAQNVLTVVTLSCDPHYPRDPLTRLTDEETEALRLPDSTKAHLPEEETLTEAKGLKGPDTHQVNPARGPGC